MGTWGTGPFDSDMAEDFVDQLEGLTPERRAEVIRSRLAPYPTAPTSSLERFWRLPRWLRLAYRPGAVCRGTKTTLGMRRGSPETT